MRQLTPPRPPLLLARAAASCCSISASLRISSIVLGPLDSLRACQLRLRRSSTSWMANLMRDVSPCVHTSWVSKIHPSNSATRDPNTTSDHDKHSLANQPESSHVILRKHTHEFQILHWRAYSVQTGDNRCVSFKTQVISLVVLLVILVGRISCTIVHHSHQCVHKGGASTRTTKTQQRTRAFSQPNPHHVTLSLVYSTSLAK